MGNVAIKLGNDIDLYKNTGILSIVSDGYLEGTFHEAYNINCSIVLAQSSNARKISVAIHEFAPYAKSPEYCLYIDSFPTPYACSGSRKFHESYGPFDGKLEWKFSMFLKESADYFPKIRFWIVITSENFVEYFIFLFQ